MSNAAECCVLGICCPPAQRRKILTDSIIAFARTYASAITPDQAECFLDWVDHEEATFAPKSMQAVIDDVARLARAHPEGHA